MGPWFLCIPRLEVVVPILQLRQLVHGLACFGFMSGRVRPSFRRSVGLAANHWRVFDPSGKKYPVGIENL